MCGSIPVGQQRPAAERVGMRQRRGGQDRVEPQERHGGADQIPDDGGIRAAEHDRESEESQYCTVLIHTFFSVLDHALHIVLRTEKVIRISIV